MAGTLAWWASPRILRGQPNLHRLTDKLAIVDAGECNVLAFSDSQTFLLVDSGPPNSGDRVLSALKQAAPAAKVGTVFNTHYHPDQTGNNELFATAGAEIVAHERTRQWMSTDFWVPGENRYEKARPKAARPTQTFLTNWQSKKPAAEEIQCGYLPLAHTSGDIYVFFKTSNVLAAGDVASPLRDPALDYFTGAWIGGRVDAMDTLLALSNEQTRIVPAHGPVMTRAEFKAERDMMEEVRARLFKQIREGDGPQDMLEAGVLKGLVRTWNDPYKFLYDAAKGLWAHHDKLDRNVV
jgi:glyoxylase-like metal-dependent hydrolase (beta-lactamase superfamily II)